MTEKGNARKIRGNRVKSLRQLTRLSRRKFAIKTGISGSTLQNWEDANENGMSETGATRLIKALRNLGIFCSFEWAMHGTGSFPQITPRLFDENAPNVMPKQLLSNEQQTPLIEAELALFQQHYPDAVDFVVEDDGMEPRFIKGELLAGQKYGKDQLDQAVGLDCIVLTAGGTTLLRNIRPGDKPNSYHLVCSNPHTKIAKPILYNVEIVYAVPIIWARRYLLET